MISRTLKYTLATAILVAVMLVVTVVPVAMAKPDTADKQTKPVDGAAIDRMIEKLEPFVTRCDDGTFRLDIPKNAKINKTSPELKAILAGMNSTNELIREGELVTTPDLSVYSVDGSQFVLQDGINRYKPRWYGFEVWMNHDFCDTLGHCMTIAAAAGACTVFLGVPAYVAVPLGATLKIAAEIIGILDNGCGVHLKFLGSPSVTNPPVPFYARGQSC